MHQPQDIKLPNSKITRRAAAIPVKPEVRFIEKSARADQNIIEIEGRDRPGLLHALGNALLQEKANLLSAHIEVVGNRAIDAFYVAGPNGRLTTAQKKRLKKTLLDVLDISVEAKAA